MADGGLSSGGNGRGSVSMTWEWVKGNVPVLITLAGIGVWIVRNDTDTKADIRTLQSDISQIKDTASDRAKIADDFYQRQRDLNLPARTTALETQMKTVVEAIEKQGDAQAKRDEGLSRDVQNLSVQLSVVASKVDDLRSGIPRKAIYQVSPFTK